MSSADIGLVRELIELQAPMRAAPLAERRLQYDRAEQAFGGDGKPGEIVDAGGCPAEWVRAQRGSTRPIVLYIHGGGYSLGSTRSHRHLAASIGYAADAAVLSLDYRRAPESPFPAAIEDATAATRWLLTHTDAPVILAGDSAGGGLVVATMIALRDAGLPLPAAGVCLSPWLDLTCTADAHTRLADRDPLLSRAELKRMADAYLCDADAQQPLASPAFAELAGLPPLLIQVGAEEILLDDARTLAGSARAEGVEVTLEEWPDMIHVWHWYFPVLAEGRQAITAIAAFIRRHAAGQPLRDASTASRATPATLVQEAHLLIAPSTAGRGYLSWVYQLNGRLDTHALTRAVDDVVRRHEILRVRFAREDGQLCQTVTPFTEGTLTLVDLSGYTKRQGLQVAIADVETVYSSLSPARDPRFRATLYTLDGKTSVLAMLVAEALVDSDSGSLLTADISRAYAQHAESPLPADPPAASEVSYLDYVASHPPDPGAVARGHEHWVRQARNAIPVTGWPVTACDGDAGGSRIAFDLTPPEWARVASRAHSLGTTEYVLVLTCLQVALAHVAHITRFLAHTIVSHRGEAAEGIIGNFHSPARVDLQFDVAADLRSATARTGAAVAEAIEHSVFPAPLAGRSASTTPRCLEGLPEIRFYMFASHDGPVFAGIRRRRFRLHGLPPAPLSVSCIHGPAGRQDFAFSSTTAPETLLRVLAADVRTVITAVVEKPHMPVLSASLESSANSQSRPRQRYGSETIR
ncbi:MAG TPA: alpha/beta hydrolase fold domain-containing protein [Solirubrobacteraceae bacterium]|nr:alpha/beta hydrolase fold domain-containing protein [Solirubrobacteraceae bacterium]